MKNTIYKAVSPSGKIYIGQAINFEKRKQAHRTSSFNKNCEDYDCYFHKAIRKYGFDNFQWNVLKENLISKQHMNMWERLWIFIEKSNDPKTGYNETEGGEGVPKGTVPWNKGKKGVQVSTRKGTILSEEQRKIISQKTKEAMNRPEVKEKLSKSEKPILCLESKIIYKSQQQAAKLLGLRQPLINKVLSGQRTHTGGFSFKFVEKVK